MGAPWTVLGAGVERLSSVERERAMLEWAEAAAPRIALDGPEDPDELEAIASVYELVLRTAPGDADRLRTLGYLHARERRWGDAETAFEDAAACAREEAEARRLLDLARLALIRGAHPEAIAQAERGLTCAGLWYTTRDELRDALERALGAAGRADEALAVLDDRAAESSYSFALHHRLARERIARGDLNGAGLALERAAAMRSILGPDATQEQRVAASFDPIIGELRAAGRAADARQLAALTERILGAN